MGMGKVCLENGKVVEKLEVVVERLVKVKGGGGKGEYMGKMRVRRSMGGGVSVKRKLKGGKGE